MKTPMLKRRLNPFLLVSTVLILSLLAGLSVLYQGQINNLVEEKKDLKQQIEQKDRRISKIQQEKSNLSADLQRMQQLYQNKEKNATTLLEELKKVRAKLENLRDQVRTLQASNTTSSTRDVNDTFALVCFDEETQLSAQARAWCQSEGHQTR
ncbi:MAG: hypothetical protein ABEJ64_02060 [Candidatus Nanohaloarchaea archaeon]